MSTEAQRVAGRRHNPTNRCNQCRAGIAAHSHTLRDVARRLSRYRDLSTVAAQNLYAESIERKGQLLESIALSKNCEACHAVKNNR